MVKLIDIMSESLVILYNEFENGNSDYIDISTLLPKGIFFDKIKSALNELESGCDLIETVQITKEVVHGRIKPKGIYLVEKGDGKHVSVASEISKLIEPMHISMENSNLAINSNSIEQKIKNDK
jgi:hypothetical protein